MSQPVDHAEVKRIFQEVCEQPEGERAEFLARETRGRPALRAEIDSLLHFDSVDGDLFSESRVGSSLPVSEDGRGIDDGPLPERIGSYRIIRCIGSGGMGSVYEAEQAAPLRRVALKVMRRGRSSREILKRFEREGQIQGRLTHPGIAAVYETGVDASSGKPVPFFAMELVEGLPLGEFCRRRGLGVDERLALIAEVCDAVSFAHQRGVVHRDLKPDNILVPEIGGRTQPKILDFGVAKLAEQDLRAVTMQTEAGQLIGTLAYMSPEQLRGRVDEIDTRTDIYAMGVLLFELLAGRGCYDTEGLPFAEAARRMAEEEPLRLGSLRPMLKGDIETIVHKAIERDRHRRYASASELAADIRRYLGNEPIAARPATLYYQASKFARRHRGVVMAMVMVLATLVAGIIATSVMAVKAGRARDIAERKTETAEGVSSVLLNALTTATPKGSLGKEPYLIDAINRVEAQAENEENQVTPEVRAVALNIVGIIYRERGDYARAEKDFLKALQIRRRVLAPGDPNLADSLNNMGLLRKRQERFEEAAAYYEEAVQLQRRSSYHDDARLARNLYNLASALIAAGNTAKAKPVLAESRAMHERLPGASDEQIGYHISAESRIASAEGRWGEALALAEQALAFQRRAVGPDHPTIVTALADLAAIKSHDGDEERAIELLREADAMARRVFTNAATHPSATLVRKKLAEALRRKGLIDEASELEGGAGDHP